MAMLARNKTKSKVFVGMSGGVDSSVTALLLKNQGYNVVGVFMRCYNLDGCAERDAEDARRVAEHIGIPFYVWDFEEEYKQRVVEYMIDGYRAGITPNPDVMCNREIKFGLFLEKALAAGADFVATGHYVRKKESKRDEDRKFSLFVAHDKNKDQSYFLWTLTQKQLAHCLFPIGNYSKPDVRHIAARAGLPTAAKKDSQGICFLGDISVADFLKQYIPARRGALVTTAGEQIGEHFGAEFYTIGQRHIDADFRFPKTGGVRHDREPFYVAAKDAATNTVVVAEGDEHEALYRREIELTSVNFLTGVKDGGKNLILEKPPAIFARVRYRQLLAPAKLSRSPLSSGNFRLEFARPQKFVASGQSAVWYSRKGEMLGGGVIL
jgi:tRNA-uridine 2-sulfurtransferase